jgi:competence protein ComEA
VISGRVAETRTRAELRLRELFTIDDPPPAEEPDEGRGGVRLGIDRRAVAALVVIALGGVVLAGAVVLRSRPHVTEVPAPTVIAVGSPIPSPGIAPPPAAELVVDVQGKVRRPGVVRLPAGARVLDALRAAGGPRPGVPTTSLNLARQLTDGEQVVLDPAGAVAVGSATVSGAAGGVVNLNTASLEDLDGLPGVGPVLAQRILDWREEHGRFSAVEELQEVPGIGPSTFADLKDRVRV